MIWPVFDRSGDEQFALIRGHLHPFQKQVSSWIEGPEEFAKLGIVCEQLVVEAHVKQRFAGVKKGIGEN